MSRSIVILETKKSLFKLRKKLRFLCKDLVDDDSEAAHLLLMEALEILDSVSEMIARINRNGY